MSDCGSSPSVDIPTSAVVFCFLLFRVPDRRPHLEAGRIVLNLLNHSPQGLQTTTSSNPGPGWESFVFFMDLRIINFVAWPVLSSRSVTSTPIVSPSPSASSRGEGLPSHSLTYSLRHVGVSIAPQCVQYWGISPLAMEVCNRCLISSRRGASEPVRIARRGLPPSTSLGAGEPASDLFDAVLDR